MLRSQIHEQKRTDVKHAIETVNSSDVYFTQESSSNRFRDARTLDELKELLRCGLVDPMRDGFLILNVVQTNMRRTFYVLAAALVALQASLIHCSLVCPSAS